MNDARHTGYAIGPGGRRRHPHLEELTELLETNVY